MSSCHRVQALSMTGQHWSPFGYVSEIMSPARGKYSVTHTVGWRPTWAWAYRAALREHDRLWACRDVHDRALMLDVCRPFGWLRRWRRVRVV